MNPRKQKTRSLVGGRAWVNSIGEGLAIPHIVNARAVASVQPCGWRGQQHVGQYDGAKFVTAYKLGPSLWQVNGAAAR